MADGDTHITIDHDKGEVAVGRERVISGGSGEVIIGGKSYPMTSFEVTSIEPITDELPTSFDFEIDCEVEVTWRIA